MLRSTTASMVCSVALHALAIVALAVVSPTMNLGTGTKPAALVTTAAVVQVSIQEQRPLDEAPDPASVLASALPEPEQDDWQAVLAAYDAGTKPMAEPVTTFCDDDDWTNPPACSAEAADEQVARSADVDLAARFDEFPRPRGASEALGSGDAGGGGSAAGDDTIGVAGAAGGAGGQGGGTGTGIGTGSGSGNGAGSGSGDGTVSGAGTSGIGTRRGSSGPRAVKMVRGDYPLDARRAGAEGTVLLQIEVLHTGRIGKVEVVRSSGNGSLDSAACHVIQQWEFLPAERDSQAVASLVRLSYVFQLKDAR